MHLPSQWEFYLSFDTEKYGPGWPLWQVLTDQATCRLCGVAGVGNFFDVVYNSSSNTAAVAAAAAATTGDLTSDKWTRMSAQSGITPGTGARGSDNNDYTAVAAAAAGPAGPAAGPGGPGIAAAAAATTAAAVSAPPPAPTGWTVSVFGAANAFGLGRMAWNPGATADAVTREWLALSFGGTNSTTDTNINSISTTNSGTTVSTRRARNSTAGGATSSALLADAHLTADNNDNDDDDNDHDDDDDDDPDDDDHDDAAATADSSRTVAGDPALAAFVDAVAPAMLASWEVFENYTSPLGLGYVVDSLFHYWMDPDGWCGATCPPNNGFGA